MVSNEKRLKAKSLEAMGGCVLRWPWGRTAAMATQRQPTDSCSHNPQSYNKCFGEAWRRHALPKQNNQNWKLVTLGSSLKPPSIFQGCVNRQTLPWFMAQLLTMDMSGSLPRKEMIRQLLWALRLNKRGQDECPAVDDQQKTQWHLRRFLFS